jgi:hypothetical protein
LKYYNLASKISKQRNVHFRYFPYDLVFLCDVYFSKLLHLNEIYYPATCFDLYTYVLYNFIFPVTSNPSATELFLDEIEPNVLHQILNDAFGM